MHRIHFGKESARNELVYLTDVIRKEIAIFGLIMKLIKTVIILFIENGQLGKYKVQSCKTFFKTPKEYYKSLYNYDLHIIPTPHTPKSESPVHLHPTPHNPYPIQSPPKFLDYYTVTSTLHFHTHTDQNTIAKS